MDSMVAEHITKTPGICGGRACIAGHRIRVQDIVVWHEVRGYTVPEIVDMFPGISRADVHAALVYYYDNMEEIENAFRKDEELGRGQPAVADSPRTEGEARWLSRSVSTWTSTSQAP